ncbi:hypothetical protein ACTL6P_19080 [Endozoicomonas acroporae]|uniref:hypothetical protein n=1 Tax=Endozoicomonas acroporae TaxID=1701104 RepID=UPI000C78939D|nr:hypothetical protein [Endozoicomonas acroporae]
MLSVQSTPPPLQSTPTGNEKAVKDVEVSRSTQPVELTQLQKCILDNQRFILDTVNLVKVMNKVFGKKEPDASLRKPDNFDALPEPEKYESLTKLVRQLDVYFHQSPILREEQGKIVERWNAIEQTEVIENLSDAAKNELRSALEPLRTADSEPLEFTDQSVLLFPGAAIPRMHLRPKFAIAQNSDNKLPGLLLCNGSSRTLGDVDELQDVTSNDRLFKRMGELVKKFETTLGSTTTEAHAQMALMDMLRMADQKNDQKSVQESEQISEEKSDQKSQQTCFLNKQTIYVTYTGEVQFFQQSLQEDGKYTLNLNEENIITGRPNTEATMVSALNALELLPGATPGDIVLVSNQPHIRAQQIATERVVANRGYNNDYSPITIRACGDECSLTSSKDLFLAIDSARKAIQLLNPDYHVTTNWVKAPEWKLFESRKAGEWQLYKPEQPPLELLV